MSKKAVTVFCDSKGSIASSVAGFPADRFMMNNWFCREIRLNDTIGESCRYDRNADGKRFIGGFFFFTLSSHLSNCLDLSCAIYYRDYSLVWTIPNYCFTLCVIVLGNVSKTNRTQWHPYLKKNIFLFFILVTKYIYKAVCWCHCK